MCSREKKPSSVFVACAGHQGSSRRPVELEIWHNRVGKLFLVRVLDSGKEGKFSRECDQSNKNIGRKALKRAGDE